MNICRVNKESDIDKILLEKKNVITMLIYAYGEPKLKIFMKRILAKTFDNCYFILALMDKQDSQKPEYNFMMDKSLSSFDMRTLSYVVFYYDLKQICTIKMAEPKSILHTLTILVDKLNNANQQPSIDVHSQSQSNDNQQAQSLEMEILKMAREHQIEKIDDDAKLHEINELQKIMSMKKKHKNKNEKIRDNESSSDCDDNKKKHKIKKTK